MYDDLDRVKWERESKDIQAYTLSVETSLGKQRLLRQTRILTHVYKILHNLWEGEWKYVHMRAAEISGLQEQN